MARKRLMNLGPSLIVGVGLILSTLVAMRTAEFGWLVMAGPLLMALAAIGASMLGSRLRGGAAVPSRSALLMAGAILLAGAIVALRDPGLVKTLIPVIAAPAWVTLVLLPRRRQCLPG